MCALVTGVQSCALPFCFRPWLGILSLARSYGPVRVEAACRRGLSIGASSYGSIASILKNGLDKAFLPDAAPDPDPIRHANNRGQDYFHWPPRDNRKLIHHTQDPPSVGYGKRVSLR